jgi:hypothetical protein
MTDTKETFAQDEKEYVDSPELMDSRLWVFFGTATAVALGAGAGVLALFL